MSDAVPDLRQTLREADESELGEIFDAFDVSATYTKDTQCLKPAATVAPQAMVEEATAKPERSQVFGIAGAGFEPATFGL